MTRNCMATPVQMANLFRSCRMRLGMSTVADRPKISRKRRRYDVTSASVFNGPETTLGSDPITDRNGSCSDTGTSPTDPIGFIVGSLTSLVCPLSPCSSPRRSLNPRSKAPALALVVAASLSCGTKASDSGKVSQSMTTPAEMVRPRRLAAGAHWNFRGAFAPTKPQGVVPFRFLSAVGVERAV